MRALLSTIAELVGAALVVTGVAQVSAAAACVVGGVLLVGIGYLVGNE